MSAFMLYFFKIFVKWINSCFYSLNLKLCCFIHSTTLFYVFFKTSQFHFINLLYVKMLMSSTNSMKLKHNLTSSHASNKFALYNKYKIEKNNEFCDISTFVMRFICVYSLIINVILLCFKKFSIYFSNLFDIFFFILWKSRICDTLSKTSLTFKLKKDIIFFFYLFHIVWIFFVMNCKIMFIKRCQCALICVFENVFNVSTT